MFKSMYLILVFNNEFNLFNVIFKLSNPETQDHHCLRNLAYEFKSDFFPQQRSPAILKVDFIANDNTIITNVVETTSQTASRRPMATFSACVTHAKSLSQPVPRFSQCWVLSLCCNYSLRFQFDLIYFHVSQKVLLP